MTKKNNNPKVAANSDMKSSAFWDKLVPNSEIEFSLYAKHLAWILECKLTDAQNILAKMYGHEDAAQVHELLNAQDAPKGPFLDAPPAAADFGSVNYIEWRLHTEQRTHEEVMAYLSTRPIDLSSTEYRKELRYSLVNEIGLFCTTKVHQNLMKRTKSIIASGSRICSTGFPVGFLLSMHWYFGGLCKEDKAAYSVFNHKAEKHLKQFITEDGLYSQREMLEFAMERKVAGLLALTIENLTSESDFLSKDNVPAGLIDIAESALEWHEWDKPLNVAFADEVISDFLKGDSEESEDSDDARKARRDMSLFLLNPCNETASKCGALKVHPNIVHLLPNWRCAVLFALARTMDEVNSEHGENQFEVVETYRRLSGEYQDISSPWLRLTGILSKNSGWNDLNRWNLTLQVSLQDKDTDILEPVGRICGAFINVLGEDGYKDDQDLEEALDDDDVMLQAWQHVKKHYRDRRGFEGMHEWVNSDEAHGFAMVKTFIANKFASTISEAVMLDMLGDVFSENVDFPEFSAAELVLDEPDFMGSEWNETFEERKYNFHHLGVVVMHTPGSGDLALSISEMAVSEGDQLEITKGINFLRRNGQALSANNSFWWHGPKRKGLAPNETDRLMQAGAQSSVNLIVFDPLPWKPNYSGEEI